MYFLFVTKKRGKGLELSKTHQSHLYATRKVLLTTPPAPLLEIRRGEHEKNGGVYSIGFPLKLPLVSKPLARARAMSSVFLVVPVL